MSSNILYVCLYLHWGLFKYIVSHRENTIIGLEENIFALTDRIHQQELELSTLRKSSENKDKQIASMESIINMQGRYIQSLSNTLLKLEDKTVPEKNDNAEAIMNRNENTDSFSKHHSNKEFDPKEQVEVNGKSHLTSSEQTSDVNLMEYKDELSNTGHDMAKRIVMDELGIKKHVAFSAYLGHLIRPISYGAKVPCDQVLLNLGNAYNGATGIFTVSDTGVYLLTFYINSVVANTKVYVKLVKNGSTIVGAVADPEGSNHDAMGGNTAIVNLTKGERVWLEVHGTSNGELQSNSVHRYVTFSGIRLI